MGKQAVQGSNRTAPKTARVARAPVAVNELALMVRRLYPLKADHVQLFNARLGALQGTINLYAQVGKKFSKAQLDDAIDAAFVSTADAIRETG